jgi:hypothetical protein
LQNINRKSLKKMFGRQENDPRSAYEIKDFIIAILRVFYWLYEILQLDARHPSGPLSHILTIISPCPSLILP